MKRSWALNRDETFVGAEWPVNEVYGESIVIARIVSGVFDINFRWHFSEHDGLGPHLNVDHLDREEGTELNQLPFGIQNHIECDFGDAKKLTQKEIARILKILNPNK